MAVVVGRFNDNHRQESTKRTSSLQAKFRCKTSQAQVRHPRRVSEPKHRLAQAATGPYQVRRSDEHTVVIAIGDQEERVSRDRVELAPSPMENVPITGLRQALQFLGGPEASQEQDVADSENHLRATSPEGEGELEANSDKSR